MFYAYSEIHLNFRILYRLHIECKVIQNKSEMKTLLQLFARFVYYFVETGVGVTYSFKNTRTMIAGLESVQESREMLEGGSGFYGILRASELIPYDSAIFISTDKIPQDISLMKNAATVLLKKRIRVSESKSRT